VEAVQDVCGLRGLLRDDLQVGSPHIRADEHALRRRLRSPAFALSHVPDSIRPATERLLLVPTSHRRPSISLPYGRLAAHCTRRSDGFSAFHVITLTDDLGGTWTPVALRSRAGMLETCNLATHANTGKHACDLIASVGRYRADGEYLPSKYSHRIAPTLALNRTKLPEGFACRQAPTQFGTLSARLRTSCTAHNPHARVG